MVAPGTRMSSGCGFIGGPKSWRSSKGGCSGRRRTERHSFVSCFEEQSALIADRWIPGTSPAMTSGFLTTRVVRHVGAGHSDAGDLGCRHLHGRRPAAGLDRRTLSAGAGAGGGHVRGAEAACRARTLLHHRAAQRVARVAGGGLATFRQWRALALWFAMGTIVCFADAAIAASSTGKLPQIVFHIGCGIGCCRAGRDAVADGARDS